VDTIKVQMMQNRGHRSSLACLISMVRTEGVLSPYRGLAMCWVRLWPHTVVRQPPGRSTLAHRAQISLSLFEELRRLTGLRPI
jgi:hypothetical protein